MSSIVRQTASHFPPCTLNTLDHDPSHGSCNARRPSHMERGHSGITDNVDVMIMLTKFMNSRVLAEIAAPLRKASRPSEQLDPAGGGTRSSGASNRDRLSRCAD